MEPQLNVLQNGGGWYFLDQWGLERSMMEVWFSSEWNTGIYIAKGVTLHQPKLRKLDVSANERSEKENAFYILWANLDQILPMNCGRHYVTDKVNLDKV